MNKYNKIAIIALIFALIALNSVSTITNVYETYGINGTDGIDGINGTNGVDGINGTNGINGSDGVDGINGTNGINGTSAIATIFMLHNVSSETTIYDSLRMNSTIILDIPKTSQTYTNIENGEYIIQNWTTQLPTLGLGIIPAGIVSMHIHAEKIGNAHIDTILFSIGSVGSTGENYSQFGISEYSGVIPDSSGEIELNLYGVILQTQLNNTDRIKLQLFVNQTGTGVNPSIKIYMDGLTVSGLTIPAIPIDFQSVILHVANNTENINQKLNKSGDTMTGDLNMGENLIYGVGGINMVSTYPSVIESALGVKSAGVLTSSISPLVQLYSINDITGNQVSVYTDKTTFTDYIDMLNNNITNCANCITQANLNSSVDLSSKLNKSGDTMGGILDVSNYGIQMSSLNITSRANPIMTSATNPNGIVTASSYLTSYEAWRAFDGINNGNGWAASPSTNQWLTYEFATNAKISGYNITSRNDVTGVRAPKNWTFEGSNGSTYIVLDTQTNVTDWAVLPAVSKIYTISEVNYIKYKINISISNDPTYVGIGELEFLSAGNISYCIRVNTYGVLYTTSGGC